MSPRPEFRTYNFAGHEEHVLCFAAGSSRRILIIPPLFDEMNRCRRMLVQAMRELAAANGASADSMPMAASSEHRRQMYAHNLNSCHVWDEDGEWVAAVERGDAVEQPLWITERLVQLGRDPSEWRGMRP